MRFESPWFLLLLLIIPLYLFFKYKGTKSGKLNLSPTLLFSSTEIFSRKNKQTGTFYDIAEDLFLNLAILFLIIALARPLGGQAVVSDRAKGVDIVLSIDVSGSMLFVDEIPYRLHYRDILGSRIYFDPERKLEAHNRLNTVKRVVAQYIEKQTFNRIGIVVFGGSSYTRCPLTFDKNMLLKIVDEIHFRPENNGTAIGMGIATAVNRLRHSEAESRVIILLTDGVNNAGMIDPISAAELARDKGIKIYAIGVGNPHGYLEPRNREMTEYVMRHGDSFDEATTRQIAEITGGKFFAAHNPASLESVYNEIDRLEKTEYEIRHRVLYTENFFPFLLAGFILLGVYIGFTSLVIKLP
jgi:Ca-activated chloride channel family protein